ncbi:MAG: ATP-binding cassette domain-containing protein [Vulcanimicrobiaceae bacterium]
MLVVDRIARSFGSAVAVRDVSFTVDRASIVALLGPNGAGKTTTMRMILGIYVPDRGAIAWRGAAIDRATRRRFGYLPEERGLYAKMSVRDQIAYMGRLHGLRDADARARTATWMETLDIARYATRACGELSKGNQQKVQLASAVLHEPEVLVLDEPFSGLDPVNAETMLACIRSLAAGGTTLVLSSHQLYAIESVCHSFCIVGAGEVRASGTLAQLRSTFPTRTVRVRPDLPAIREAFARAGAPGPASGDPGELVYELPTTTDFGALLRAAVAAGPVDSFERSEPSLGAIYVDALARPGARA